MVIVVRPRGQPVQRPRQPYLGRRVDGRRRLVEHQQVGVGEVGTGQRHQLALARRQRPAALADRVSRPLLEPLEPVGRAAGRRTPAAGRRRSRRAARTGRWRRSWCRTGTRPAAPSPPGGAATRTARRRQRHAREQDRAAHRVHQPGQQLGERRLARPGLADDRHPGTGSDVQVDVAAAPRVRRGRRSARGRTVTSSGPAGRSLTVGAGVGDIGWCVEDLDAPDPTRRSAFCASFNVSVAACTGLTNSVTRNRNATSLPGGEVTAAARARRRPRRWRRWPATTPARRS